MSFPRQRRAFLRQATNIGFVTTATLKAGNSIKKIEYKGRSFFVLILEFRKLRQSFYLFRGAHLAVHAQKGVVAGLLDSA